MSKFLSRILRGDATKGQAQDTGMAVVLVLLLVWFARKREGYIILATVAQLVNMTAPQVFKPVAVIWLTLSHYLGMVMSRVILTLIFFVVVTPIGMVRRLMGADSLKLKGFKSGRQSVMAERNHTFTGADLEHPY